MSRLTQKLTDVAGVEAMTFEERNQTRPSNWNLREMPDAYKPYVARRFAEDVNEHIAEGLPKSGQTEFVRVWAQLLTIKELVEKIKGIPDSRHLLGGQGPIRLGYGIFNRSTNTPADIEADGYDESDPDVVGLFEYKLSETSLQMVVGNGATVTKPGTFDGPTWPFSVEDFE